MSRLVSNTGSGLSLLSTSDTAERYEGIGYYRYEPPVTVLFSSDTTGQTIELLENGPAVVRLAVTWSNDEAAFRGQTIYTVIADGRIMRDQSVSLDGLDAFSELLAYVAIDPSAFDRLTEDRDPPFRVEPETIDLATFEDQGNQASSPGITLCAENDVGDVLGYVPSRHALDGSPLRAGTTWYLPGSALSMKQGFEPNASGTHRAHSAVFVTPPGIESTCECALLRGRNYDSPATLLVDGATSIIRPDDVDGDSFDQSSGAYALEPVEASTELRVSKRVASLLLHLSTDASPTDVTVHVNGVDVPSEAVLAQVAQITPGLWLLINRELVPDDVVVVELLE